MVLSGSTHLFSFDLDLNLAAGGLDLAAGGAISTHEVHLVPNEARIAAARDALGGDPLCNALVMHLDVDFSGDGSRERSGGLHQRRAVLFVEPMSVQPDVAIHIVAAHNGHRVWLVPRVACPPNSWGRVMLQHWHFAMVRDAPRNEAYARALHRAATTKRMARAIRGSEEYLALDVGAGSCLLSLMLAREVREAYGEAGGRIAGTGMPFSLRSLCMSDLGTLAHKPC